MFFFGDFYDVYAPLDHLDAPVVATRREFTHSNVFAKFSLNK